MLRFDCTRVTDRGGRLLGGCPVTLSFLLTYQLHGLPAMEPHNNVQVDVGQKGGNEKPHSLSTVKRDGTGRAKARRNSQM